MAGWVKEEEKKAWDSLAGIAWLSDSPTAIA